MNSALSRSFSWIGAKMSTSSHASSSEASQMSMMPVFNKLLTTARPEYMSLSPMKIWNSLRTSES
jgi:hypothetical protein